MSAAALGSPLPPLPLCWMQQGTSDVKLPDSFSSRSPVRCVELSEAPDAAAKPVACSARVLHGGAVAYTMH